MVVAAVVLGVMVLASRVSAQPTVEDEAAQPAAMPTATAPIDDRPLLRPRYAPSTRVGGQLDSMLGPTRGLAARAWASIRFRAPVALRVRVRPAGFAMIGGSAQPMGAVDAAFALDTGPVGLHVGAGVGWLLRRRRELSSGDGQAFGFGHYVLGGARVGDADSFGVDVEATFATAHRDDVGVTLEVQLDMALRFALGPVALLTLHGEVGTVTPSSIRVASEARIRVRGDGGPGSVFVIGAIGWQQLTLDDLDSSRHPHGPVVSFGSEARFGSRHVSRPLLAERRLRVELEARIAPTTEDARREAAIRTVERRGSRLRRSGRVMLCIASAATVVGATVTATARDLDQGVAGVLVLMTAAAPMWIAGNVTLPVGKRQLRAASWARLHRSWPRRRNTSP